MFITFENESDLMDLLEIDSLDIQTEDQLIDEESLEYPSLQVYIIDAFNKRQKYKENDVFEEIIFIDPRIFLNLNEYLNNQDRKHAIKQLKNAIKNNLSLAKTYKEYKYYKTLLQIMNSDHFNNSAPTSLTEIYFIKELDTLTEKFNETLTNKNYKMAEFLMLNHWQRFKLKQFSKKLNENDQFFNLPIQIKLKIIKYNRLCSKVLEFLFEHHKEEGTLPDFKELLFKIKRKLGNTAITLSGGGTFSLFHIGILVNLFDMNKLPQFVSGCSGGAIVASIFAVFLSHENQYENIKKLLARIIDKEQKFDIFGETSLMEGFVNLIYNGSFFADTKRLQQTLINFLGERTTFNDVHSKEKMALNISVSGNTPSSATKEFLLNFNNSPDVLLWSCVTSSCSLPLIFPPHMIYSRNNNAMKNKSSPNGNNNFLKVWNGNNNKFLDGSMLQDLPIKKLSEMFNIDNVIASQVNPHIFPILHIQNYLNKKRLQKRNGNSYVRWLLSVLEYFYTEIIHWLSLLRFTSIENIFKQNYYGDMTVLPSWSLLFHMNKLLANPDGDFILYLIVLGIKQFWFYSGDFMEFQLFLEFELDSWIEKCE
ncbi:patatin-domain-containing protein [Hanseniaspora valbyensis NRRL Y-1626]|uniref:Patatin-domain-containing protein n=1 Tax=Hanseniaspora valbyensis NRRL Y-1626 TaxID=766949 RepID=A0A1B7THS2_9ASCO|nr:patatin-domain-containing protein [Hanseniaspora valbyensis NRRL Y-1626]